MRKHRLVFILVIFLVSRLPLYCVERPKIGLVLSGGGAKGLAHIGTLKLIDELQLPIDLIVGTSIGGIVGSLYAIGYTGEEIEELTRGLDWGELFTDRPERKSLPFIEKKQDGKYQLDFGIERLLPNPLSGIVFGQKISLLFSSLTFPYEQINDFDKLPIPVRCIAIDLITGKEVILKSGSLAKAMRATMAIPTFFSPVEWGEYLLIDGGVLNNFPVRTAHEMGADIVIAVDLGAPLKTREELKTMVDVLGQTINLAELSHRKEDIEQADILITPNMKGYNTLDFFSPEKMESIRKEGEAAAEKERPQLEALLEKIGLEKTHVHLNKSRVAPGTSIGSLQFTGFTTIPFRVLQEKLAAKPGDTYDYERFSHGLTELKEIFGLERIYHEVIPISDKLIRILIHVKEKNRPHIAGITISGHKELPASFIYRLLGLESGDILDTDELNRRIMSLYALGYFETINYDVFPMGENKINLNLQVKEMPKRKLRIGMRYDNIYKLVAAGGIYASNVLFPGARIESEVQLGGLTQIWYRLSYPSRALNRFIYPFLQLKYKNIPTNIFDGGGNRIARYKDRSLKLSLGFGLNLARWFNAEVSYRTEYINTRPKIAYSDPILFPSWKDTLNMFVLNAQIDTLDDVLLPRAGIFIKAEYEGSYAAFKSDIAYSKRELMVDFYVTFWKRHTIRTFGFWGDSTSSLPIYKYFNMGRPEIFIGMDYDQVFGGEMKIIRSEYRLTFNDMFYGKIIGNLAFDIKNRLPNFTYTPERLWGAGFGLGLNSPLGPLEICYGIGSKSMQAYNSMQGVLYLSLGTRF